MLEQIIKILMEFYNKLLDFYIPTYFAWMAEILKNTNPFAMISISLVLFFILTVYLWFRNSNN